MIFQYMSPFFQRCQVVHCLEMGTVLCHVLSPLHLPGIQHRIKLLFCGPTGTGPALKRMFPILNDFTPEMVVVVWLIL